MWQIMCAHEIFNEGPLQRITGPFIIIFPALNPASVVYPISLGTPSVLPIDPKVLSDLFLVTVTTICSNLSNFFPTRISSILQFYICLRSGILRMYINIGLSC